MRLRDHTAFVLQDEDLEELGRSGGFSKGFQSLWLRWDWSPPTQHQLLMCPHRSTRSAQRGAQLPRPRGSPRPSPSPIPILSLL